MRSGSLGKSMGMPGSPGSGGLIEDAYATVAAAGDGWTTGADGKKRRTFSDGTTLIKSPDGNRAIQLADGSLHSIGKTDVPRVEMGMPASFLQSGDRLPQAMYDAVNRKSEMAWLASHGGGLWQGMTDEQRAEYLAGGAKDPNQPLGQGFAAITNPETLAASPFGKVIEEDRARVQDRLAGKYATNPNGTIDFTRLADGRPSGLDRQGRAPYMNDGSIDPLYQGPRVPGSVGVPDAAHAPEWSATHQAMESMPPNLGVDQSGLPIANPEYQAGYTGWHLGDQPAAPDQGAYGFVPAGPSKVPTDAVAKAQKYLANLQNAKAKAKSPAKKKEFDAEIRLYSRRIREYLAR